jgi:hypothetical protein
MEIENLGIGRFRAKKTDHEAIVRNMREFYDYECAHPEIYHYSSTRTYTMPDENDPEKEYWMFVDKFNDYEDYINSLYNASHGPENKEGQQLMARVVDLHEGFIGNVIDHWTEVPTLRVDDLGR